MAIIFVQRQFYSITDRGTAPVAGKGNTWYSGAI